MVQNYEGKFDKRFLRGYGQVGITYDLTFLLLNSRVNP